MVSLFFGFGAFAQNQNLIESQKKFFEIQKEMIELKTRQEAEIFSKKICKNNDNLPCFWFGNFINSVSDTLIYSVYFSANFKNKPLAEFNKITDEKICNKILNYRNTKGIITDCNKVPDWRDDKVKSYWNNK